MSSLSEIAASGAVVLGIWRDDAAIGGVSMLCAEGRRTCRTRQVDGQNRRGRRRDRVDTAMWCDGPQHACALAYDLNALADAACEDG
jgi:hypothetical protein